MRSDFWLNSSTYSTTVLMCTVPVVCLGMIYYEEESKYYYITTCNTNVVILRGVASLKYNGRNEWFTT